MLLRSWLWSNVILTLVFCLFVTVAAVIWGAVCHTALPEQQDTAAFYTVLGCMMLYQVGASWMWKYMRYRYDRYVDRYFDEVAAFAVILTPSIVMNIERYCEFQESQKKLRELTLKAMEQTRK